MTGANSKTARSRPLRADCEIVSPFLPGVQPESTSLPRETDSMFNAAHVELDPAPARAIPAAAEGPCWPTRLPPWLGRWS